MRQVPIGTTKWTKVFAVDEPGPGGANHEYAIVLNVPEKEQVHPEESILGTIEFQKGPVRENGLNGIFMEDLLVIVEDRLRGFQSGPYACGENDSALKLIRAAREMLVMRAEDREKRGVLGTSKI